MLIWMHLLWLNKIFGSDFLSKEQDTHVYIYTWWETARKITEQEKN